MQFYYHVHFLWHRFYSKCKCLSRKVIYYRLTASNVESLILWSQHCCCIIHCLQKRVGGGGRRAEKKQNPIIGGHAVFILYSILWKYEGVQVKVNFFAVGTVFNIIFLLFLKTSTVAFCFYQGIEFNIKISNIRKFGGKKFYERNNKN